MTDDERARWEAAGRITFKGHPFIPDPTPEREMTAEEYDAACRWLVQQLDRAGLRTPTLDLKAKRLMETLNGAADRMLWNG